MLLSFGKHNGKSVEELILKNADYIQWILSQNAPKGQMGMVAKEAQRLIAKFNQKQFSVVCAHSKCESIATRCSVYGPNIQCVFWCDNCNPYSRGACEGKLQIIRTYQDAIDHVNVWCKGKNDLSKLIQNIAKGKGLPSRVGMTQAIAFFNGI